MDDVLKTELHAFVQAMVFLWVLVAALSQHGVSEINLQSLAEP